MADGATATGVQRKDPVASIAGQLSKPSERSKLSTGDHAMLRRLYLASRPGAEGIVVKLLLQAGLEPYEYQADYGAWRIMVHIAALVSGTGRVNPHDPRRGLGTALREAGFSESRLLRLTAARGAALQDQVVLAGRMLSNKGGAFNLRTLLNLVGQDVDRAEKARVRMAQEYYETATRSEEDAK